MAKRNLREALQIGKVATALQRNALSDLRARFDEAEGAERGVVPAGLGSRWAAWRWQCRLGPRVAFEISVETTASSWFGKMITKVWVPTSPPELYNSHERWKVRMDKLHHYALPWACGRMPLRLLHAPFTQAQGDLVVELALGNRDLNCSARVVVGDRPQLSASLGDAIRALCLPAVVLLAAHPAIMRGVRPRRLRFALSQAPAAVGPSASFVRLRCWQNTSPKGGPRVTVGAGPQHFGLLFPRAHTIHPAVFASFVKVLASGALALRTCTENHAMGMAGWKEPVPELGPGPITGHLDAWYAEATRTLEKLPAWLRKLETCRRRIAARDNRRTFWIMLQLLILEAFDAAEQSIVVSENRARSRQIYPWEELDDHVPDHP